VTGSSGSSANVADRPGTDGRFSRLESGKLPLDCGDYGNREQQAWTQGVLTEKLAPIGSKAKTNEEQSHEHLGPHDEGPKVWAGPPAVETNTAETTETGLMRFERRESSQQCTSYNQRNARDRKMKWPGPRMKTSWQERDDKDKDEADGCYCYGRNRDASPTGWTSGTPESQAKHGETFRVAEGTRSHGHQRLT